MRKEKSMFEKVLILVISCIIDNCDIMFDVNSLPPIEIYKPSADGIIIKEDFD